MISRLEKYALYFALLVAWLAMLGSLYFSNVRGFIPCEWCWRQRILMYPIVLIASVGLLRRDEELPYYTLAFSGLGLGASTYHYLLQKTTWFSGEACQLGVSCGLAYINWFGFITIPFLALMAFILIFACSIIALTSTHFIWEEDEQPAKLPLYLSLLAVILLPTALGLLPPLHQEDTSSSSDESTLSIPDGGALYREACAACHGSQGEGQDGAAPALVGTEFTLNKSNQEWIDYVREGRLASHPDNKSALDMPPSGGRADLSDDELQAILSYLRTKSRESLK